MQQYRGRARDTLGVYDLGFDLGLQVVWQIESRTVYTSRRGT
jgi:hypothetical protein